MAFSNYLELALLQHVFLVSAYTPPSNLYVALTTSTPGEADTGSTIVEPSGNNYARVNFNTWTCATVSEVTTAQNNGAIVFPTASGSWGTITSFGILDDPTTGNLLVSGNLTTSKAVSADDTPSFSSGALVVTLE